MAMQANGYLPSWTTTSKWKAYIEQFRKVPGIGFAGQSSANYGVGTGINWGDKFLVVLQQGRETKAVPAETVRNTLTTSMVKDNLIHGRTSIVLVKWRDGSRATHWIAVIGFYQKNGKTIFRIMDPYPNNWGSEITEEKLNEIMSSSVVTSQHKSKWALFFGNYRTVCTI